MGSASPKIKLESEKRTRRLFKAKSAEKIRSGVIKSQYENLKKLESDIENPEDTILLDDLTVMRHVAV